MLILARRPGERVVIGDDIVVTVMEVSASTVRLGIAAPQGVSIFREEIWLAVKEENRAAAAAAADALPSGPLGEVSAGVPETTQPDSATEESGAEESSAEESSAEESGAARIGPEASKIDSGASEKVPESAHGS
jgi:carbon storage regulator